MLLQRAEQMTSKACSVCFCGKKQRDLSINVTRSTVAVLGLFVSFISGATAADSKEAVLNETVEMASLFCFNILQKSNCTSNPPKQFMPQNPSLTVHITMLTDDKKAKVFTNKRSL